MLIFYRAKAINRIFWFTIIAALLLIVVYSVRYFFVVRPILQFQERFDRRKDLFQDSLAKWDPHAGLLVLVRGSRVPYTMISCHLPEKCISRQMCADLATAARRDLLDSAHPQEIVVRLMTADHKNGVVYTWNVLAGTTTYRSLPDSTGHSIAKWYIGKGFISDQSPDKN